VIKIALLAFGVFVVVVAIGVVLLVRGVRRLSQGTGGLAWRVTELRTRLLPPGPRRDVARLRCRLHAELRATHDMLAAAPQGLIFRADANTVLAEVSATAAALDRELAAVARFIDPGQQRAAFSTLSPQVAQLIATSYTARQTIIRTAVEDRSRQLATLRDNVAQQAAALDTYKRNGRELSL
jgi:hypothetical protein